jgi:hypothetical protein
LETIVKTFTGKHIDLSKVVAISDARFVDRMGHGGYFVEFDIDIQLLDKPLNFGRRIEADHSGDRPKPIYDEDGVTITGVRELQEKIDDLVKQWKNVIRNIQK